MAAIKPVWGIDLGQCALKAIALRLADNKVEVVDYAYLDHDKILTEPDVDRAALMSATMQKFLDKHDVAGHSLIVGVPGRHTLARFTRLPPVDKKKIPEIVKYEAQQQIPFDMDEVIWDFQSFVDEDTTEMEVGIFAMRRELMREHLRVLSDFQLEPALVQANPLALYNALRYDGWCGDEALAIIDVGTENTDLLAVDGHSLWTRTIPLGGNHFTDALVKTFKISFAKAENLKRSAGSSKYARQIFQAMRPVFADLVAEIQRSIGFYTSSRRGVKLTKLLAMGSAFKLPGLPKFIQQNVGLEVVRPTTFKRLSASHAPNAPQLMDRLLSFGVAYGLAVQGLDQAEITSNLLPPEIARQIIWRKKSPWFYAATACLVAAAAIVWGRNLADQRVLAESTGGGQPVPPPSSREVASRIIDQGPGEHLPARVFADQIVRADQFLLELKATAMRENEAMVNRLAEIEKLQAEKAVWPVILHSVHASLPQLPEELAAAIAEGPEAFKELVDSNPDAYARAKRPQVFIEQFEPTYSRDVLNAYESALSQLQGRGASPVRGAAFPEVQQARPGFVLLLRGRTPYAAGDRAAAYAFLQDEFMARIAENVPVDILHFDPARMNLLPIEPAGRATRGRSADRTAGTAVQRDPVTGELMAEDWLFDIVLTVVLGPKQEGVQDTDQMHEMHEMHMDDFE